MGRRRWTEADDAWLRQEYPEVQLTKEQMRFVLMHDSEAGRRLAAQAIIAKARRQQLGLPPPRLELPPPENFISAQFTPPFEIVVYAGADQYAQAEPSPAAMGGAGRVIVGTPLDLNSLFAIAPSLLPAGTWPKLHDLLLRKHGGPGSAPLVWMTIPAHTALPEGVSVEQQLAVRFSPGAPKHIPSLEALVRIQRKPTEPGMPSLLQVLAGLPGCSSHSSCADEGIEKMGDWIAELRLSNLSSHIASAARSALLELLRVSTSPYVDALAMLFLRDITLSNPPDDVFRVNSALARLVAYAMEELPDSPMHTNLWTYSLKTYLAWGLKDFKTERLEVEASDSEEGSTGSEDSDEESEESSDEEEVELGKGLGLLTEVESEEERGPRPQPGATAKEHH